MHRKAIAASLTSGQSSGAVNSFRPSGWAAPLFQSTARFPNNRKSPLKFWISTFVCLSSAISLFAKPDPDIFDGRVTTRSYDSESGSTAGSPDPSGGREGGEQRDIESVGGPGSGETVGSTSSKDSSTSEGGRESSGSAATQASDSTASSEDEAGSAGGGSDGRLRAKTSDTQSGNSGFGGQETRNFEDFGFGGVGAQETIEVNRSKESTSSASLLSDKRTLAPGGNDYTSAAGQEASGGSQGGNGSLGGDHGTNLPSGL
ncbi:MAG: hypothetical protein ISQ74_00350 [Puniceicoccaceae bacterium]|nr:hypothetical protein [Puniceicoccaceae bacterium]